MSSDVLSIEHDGDVATLWLDRPEARNAMGPAFWSDLPVAMAELSDDPDVQGSRGGREGSPLQRRARPEGDGVYAERRGVRAREPVTRGRLRAATARLEIKRMQASISSVADCPKPVSPRCTATASGEGST